MDAVAGHGDLDLALGDEVGGVGFVAAPDHLVARLRGVPASGAAARPRAARPRGSRTAGSGRPAPPATSSCARPPSPRRRGARSRGPAPARRGARRARPRGGPSTPAARRRTSRIAFSARNANWLSVIEISDPARIRTGPPAASGCRRCPRPARMNENSPTCASAADTKIPVRERVAHDQHDRDARSAPCRRGSARARRRASSARAQMIDGSNSMPTETKNSTANASCSGSEFCAALCDRSDSFSTTPAKNAPSANDTPKSAAEPKAMPTDSARTASVKSSRDPVRATWRRIHGITRGPMVSTVAAKATTLRIVIPSCSARFCSPAAWPPTDLAAEHRRRAPAAARARGPSRGPRR